MSHGGEAHGGRVPEDRPAAQLEGGHLLTRSGEGHGSCLRDNRCVDETVTSYLLEGVLPAEERVC